jgi:hypothetical protein
MKSCLTAFIIVILFFNLLSNDSKSSISVKLLSPNFILIFSGSKLDSFV